MAQPAPGRIVAALDIGSSKVCALIAQRGERGAIRILGTGQRESRGVNRGYIADMPATERAVREAVEQAERIAGINIDDVWVAVSACGLVSEVANVEVDLGGQQIEQSDIDALLDAGRRSIAAEGKTVLHAQPAMYTLDGSHGAARPLGLFADKLGVDINIVAADPPPVRNIDLCVRSAHLGVRAIVAAPVAAGLAMLTAEEREVGVALVDLGAGVTNVSVFVGGMLVGLASIPIGSRDITDDIASAFGARRNQAERIKCFHGSAMNSPRDNHEMIEVPPVGGVEDGVEIVRVPRAQLTAVIRGRLETLTADIATALKSLGYVGPIGRQVVLAGGGAELKGVAEYMQGILGRAVRTGRPRALTGLPDAHGGPGFATLVGLAIFAGAEQVDFRSEVASDASAPATGSPGLFGRLVAAVRSAY